MAEPKDFWHVGSSADPYRHRFKLLRGGKARCTRCGAEGDKYLSRPRSGGRHKPKPLCEAKP